VFWILSALEFCSRADQDHEAVHLQPLANTTISTKLLICCRPAWTPANDAACCSHGPRACCRLLLLLTPRGAAAPPTPCAPALSRIRRMEVLISKKNVDLDFRKYWIHFFKILNQIIFVSKYWFVFLKILNLLFLNVNLYFWKYRIYYFKIINLDL